MNKILIRLAVSFLLAGLAGALNKAEHCKCRIQTTSRIIGGKIARSTEYPWHITMSSREQEPSEKLRRLEPDDEKIEAHGYYSFAILQLLLGSESFRSASFLCCKCIGMKN